MFKVVCELLSMLQPTLFEYAVSHLDAVSPFADQGNRPLHLKCCCFGVHHVRIQVTAAVYM